MGRHRRRGGRRVGGEVDLVSDTVISEDDYGYNKGNADVVEDYQSVEDAFNISQIM